RRRSRAPRRRGAGARRAASPCRPEAWGWRRGRGWPAVRGWPGKQGWWSRSSAGLLRRILAGLHCVVAGEEGAGVAEQGAVDHPALVGEDPVAGALGGGEQGAGGLDLL